MLASGDQPSPLFSPSAAAAEAVFDAVASARRSLGDIAAEHGTTIPALSAWLQTPEAQAQLNALNSVSAAVARCGALNHLPAATAALSRILSDFNQTPLPEGGAGGGFSNQTPLPGGGAGGGFSSCTSPAASPTPHSAIRTPHSARDQILSTRRAALALHAASLLLRISRSAGIPIEHRPPRSTSPAGGGASRSEAEGAPAFSTSIASPPSRDDLSAAHAIADAVLAAPAPAAPAPPSQSAFREGGPQSEIASPCKGDTASPTSDIEHFLDAADSMSDDELFDAVRSGAINPAELFAIASSHTGASFSHSEVRNPHSAIATPGPAP